LYEKKEVYIHEAPKDETANGLLVESNKVGGRLQIIKNVRFIYFSLN
jgi:hypothetical protein